jgi:hypothetical protein
VAGLKSAGPELAEGGLLPLEPPASLIGIESKCKQVLKRNPSQANVLGWCSAGG